jgi:hypothetical protein
MQLIDLLLTHFKDGLQYEDAVELCLAIYSCNNILPVQVEQNGLCMNSIAETFANIAKLGLIKNYFSYKATLYGANYHAIEDKGHWIEIQASIFKLKTTYDIDLARKLLSHS